MIYMILPCCNYGEVNSEDKKQGNKLKRKIKGEDEQYWKSKVIMRSKTRQNKSQDLWNLELGFELEPE